MQLIGYLDAKIEAAGNWDTKIKPGPKQQEREYVGAE